MSEAKQVLERAIECWNSTDREGWAALYTDDVVYEGPGGSRISGSADLLEKYFDALLVAAPDRRSDDVVLYAEGEHVVEVARYTGTHTARGAIPMVLGSADGPELGLSLRRRLSGRGGQDQLDSHLLRPGRGLHSARSDAGSSAGVDRARWLRSKRSTDTVTSGSLLGPSTNYAAGLPPPVAVRFRRDASLSASPRLFLASILVDG